MPLKILRDLFEWPVMIFLAVGIVTAAINLTISGFSPVVWFPISFWFLLITIYLEVSMIRQHLESK